MVGTTTQFTQPELHPNSLLSYDYKSADFIRAARAFPSLICKWAGKVEGGIDFMLLGVYFPSA